MKKYIILSMISFSLLITSCDDKAYFDIPQRGVLSVKQTYLESGNDDVNALIAAVYFKVRGSYFAENFGGETQLGYTGIRYQLNMRDGDFADYYNYLGTSQSKEYLKTWSYYYTVMYWCNMIIENVPSNNIASSSVKAQVVAEARAIRAIMMMQAVQLYGNPPLADHIMTGGESNTPAAISWDFINKELAEAAELLPTKSSKTAQSTIGGRLTKEAAYSYLGKAYLWQKNYTQAATILHDKVISTGKYQLLPDFNTINSKAADFGTESIWENEITSTAGYGLSQGGMMDVTAYNWPTSSVYMPDGTFNFQGWGYNAGFSESFGAFMQQHELTSSSMKSSRYRGTLVTYEELLDPTIFTYAGGKGVKTAGIGSNEGYLRVKFLPRNSDIIGTAGNYISSFSARNECYMRYAEVLLNYAEAVAMGGTNGSTLTGLQALNLVRERAGLTDAPTLDMNNTSYGVKAERRAEFAYEGIRFIDLVRWGDAPTTLANCGKYTPYFYGYLNGNNTTIQSKEQWKISKIASIGEGFKSNKHELFPIPLVEINTNTNLIQNQGW